MAGGCSGGSRIFLRGCANSQKCYYFSNFLPKTAWKWKNLDRGGTHWIRQCILLHPTAMHSCLWDFFSFSSVWKKPLLVPAIWRHIIISVGREILPMLPRERFRRQPACDKCTIQAQLLSWFNNDWPSRAVCLMNMYHALGLFENLAFIEEIRKFFYTRHIGVFPKWSRTFIEFSQSLLVLWEHPGLLQKRWQARALLMMSIFFTEFSENI